MTDDRTCTWTEDENGAWHTDCDHIFEFVCNGPEENMFKFCPYCGRALFWEGFVDEPLSEGE